MTFQAPRQTTEAHQPGQFVDWVKWKCMSQPEITPENSEIMKNLLVRYQILTGEGQSARIPEEFSRVGSPDQRARPSRYQRADYG